MSQQQSHNIQPSTDMATVLIILAGIGDFANNLSLKPQEYDSFFDFIF